MKIIIYNPNSKGGNFDYALRLSQAYKRHPAIAGLSLILPSNVKMESAADVHKILLSDQPIFQQKIFSRLYFLFRTFINPLKLYFFLRRKKGYVIFNDFDQLSSFLWAPLFQRLKRKFVFAVFLHDPDRDHYFKKTSLSIASMRKVMSIMDIGFYHEMLPERSYYSKDKIVYVSVPHGLYDQQLTVPVNESLDQRIRIFKGGDSKLLGALGNIRHEKNYEMIIRAMKEVPGVKLLICGIPANSSVDLKSYDALVTKEQLGDRVLIIQKYLDDRELVSVSQACDGFVMYYANTFKSQSGILNLLAPLKKTLLVSMNDSPLSRLAKKYNLGLMAKADSQPDLVAMLQAFSANRIPASDWQGYFAYASWQNHVNIAIHALKKIRE